MKINQENLEKRIKSLENDVNLFKQYIKKNNGNEKIENLDSLIINSNENYNTILKNWINENSKIKSQLLYRLSRDGKEYSTFHKLCDKKGNTLLLVKLMDGNILGGFTTQNWDNSGLWKKDDNSFVFSLTSNQKRNNNPNNESIYCGHENRGPCFGFFLYFFDRKMDEVGINSNDNYYLDCTQLHNGTDHYSGNKVQEVEIFKILIE